MDQRKRNVATEDYTTFASHPLGKRLDDRVERGFTRVASLALDSSVASGREFSNAVANMSPAFRSLVPAPFQGAILDRVFDYHDVHGLGDKPPSHFTLVMRQSEKLGGRNEAEAVSLRLYRSTRHNLTIPAGTR